MAGLSLKANLNIPFLKGLKDAFPQAMFGVLSEVGYQSRALLKAGVLSGQVIKLSESKYPKDKAGKHTVSYKILKNFKGVRISSYPLNLYNPRKVYKAFAPTIENKVDNIVNKYSKNQFQKIVNKHDN